MNYVIAIEPGDKKHAFGVAVPDLPGCFSAGDTLDEANTNAREAIELWLETVIDDGLPVPALEPLSRRWNAPSAEPPDPSPNSIPSRTRRKASPHQCTPRPCPNQNPARIAFLSTLPNPVTGSASTKSMALGA